VKLEPSPIRGIYFRVSPPAPVSKRILVRTGFRSLGRNGRERHIWEGKMKNFASKVNRFLKSEDGPTAVEYAVMLALIIIVCLTAITAVGTQAAAQFNNIATKVGGAGS
jgi:pilus assembly protein Flp/PilA